jgi:hypothetical protein
MSVRFEVDPEDSDFAGIAVALGELLAAVQLFDPAHRQLLEQAWREERDTAAAAVQPGLARIFDSLQALVLQVRMAQGETR